MSQIISKLVLGRICLMSFVFVCSIFTSENAFSKGWNEVFKEVKFDAKDTSVNIKFQSYGYELTPPRVFSFPLELKIEFSETGSGYQDLLILEIDFQREKDPIWANVKYIRRHENIKFHDGFLVKKKLGLRIQTEKGFKNAFVNFKWRMMNSIIASKSIKTVKISGNWREISGVKQKNTPFQQIFTVDYVKPKNTSPFAPNNKVKIVGNADIIKVTGVNSGEIINVYNADTQAEVNSVVAQDSVVNIRLPKKQHYIVQVGHTRVIVAL